MQSSNMRKKSMAHTNELLPDVLFSVSPFLIEVAHPVEQIFTLNFEKDCQIVGQMSTMILPDKNQLKFELDPTRNMIVFRVFRQKKLNYKWSLYQRTLSGRQRLLQSVRISLDSAIDEFVSIQKQSRDLITKSKLFQNKALTNSSKMNDSSNLRGTEKSIGLRKSVIQTNNNINTNNSDSNIFSVNAKSSFLKTFTVKLTDSKIQLSYIVCIGRDEKQIQESVKQFHLGNKFNIIGKSWKKASSGELLSFKNESKFSDVQNMKNQTLLELIQEELQKSHKTMLQSSRDKSSKTKQKSIAVIVGTQCQIKRNPNQKPQKNEEISGLDSQNWYNLQIIKSSQLNRNQKKIQIPQTHQSENNKKDKIQESNFQQNSVQNDENKVSIEFANKQQSQLDKQQKQSFQCNEEQIGQVDKVEKQKITPQHEKVQRNANFKVPSCIQSASERLSKQYEKHDQAQEKDSYRNEIKQHKDNQVLTWFNHQQREKEGLFKTEKGTKNINFQSSFFHDGELIQTSPVTYRNKEAEHVIRVTQNPEPSHLKLDDIILNGKRVSVSDKSEWMRTSKSRTQDYESTEKSHYEKTYHQGKNNQKKMYEKDNNKQTHLKDGRTPKQQKPNQSLYKNEHLQVNSKRYDELIQLDINPVQPKLALEPSQQQQYDQIGFSQHKKEDITQSQRTGELQKKSWAQQNHNKVIFQMNHLKRKSTAEDSRKIDDEVQKDLIAFKPKTMQESSIWKNITIIEQQKQKQQNLSRKAYQYEYHYHGEQAVHDAPTLEINYKPDYGVGNNEHRNFTENIEKYRKRIPSMIDEEAEIRRSEQMSRNNSNIDRQQSMEESLDWGIGISQLRQQQPATQQPSPFKQWTLSQFKHLQSIAQTYSAKYVRPLVQTIQSNQFIRNSATAVRSNPRLKHILFIFAVIFMLWFSLSFGTSDSPKIDRKDPIFKQSTTKHKTKSRTKVKKK